MPGITLFSIYYFPSCEAEVLGPEIFPIYIPWRGILGPSDRRARVGYHLPTLRDLVFVRTCVRGTKTRCPPLCTARFSPGRFSGRKFCRPSAVKVLLPIHFTGSQSHLFLNEFPVIHTELAPERVFSGTLAQAPRRIGHGPARQSREHMGRCVGQG